MIVYRYTPAFAGVVLDVVSFQTELSRDVVEHRPHRGRGAQLSDRGQAPRRDTLTVVLTGTSQEIVTTRQTLLVLAGAGDARLFTHPLDGSWLARLTAFSETLDASATLSLTLVEDVPFTERIADPTETVTIQDVEALADAYDAELAMLEVSATLPADSPSGADALTMVEEWQSDRPTSAQLAELESYRARSLAVRDVLFESPEPAAWRAARKLGELRGTIELYQAGLQRIALSHHSLTVHHAVPLIQFLAQVYGATDASRLLGEVIRLNGITNPLRIAEGAILTLPRL